jgi:uncharacterized membrane protein
MGNSETNLTGTCISSAMIGAGLMYFLDPDRGRRRRALVRDKSRRLTNLVERGTAKTKCDLANRRSGIAAYVASHVPFQSEIPPDYILEARVRSKLGRLVGHPHAVQVKANHGTVTLCGDVLAGEVGGLMKGIASVPGVSRVENECRVYETAGDNPALQGQPRRSNGQMDLMQKNWSPAARFIVGSVGAVLGMYGMWRGGLRGSAMGLSGMGLVARSLTNMQLAQLAGTRSARAPITMRKTITIAAPVDEVYHFWTNYENFPKFMPHIKEVREMMSGRSHWVACGPGGTEVEWDAEITEAVPNSFLAWRSTPGSVIENSGSVRFESAGDAGTRVTINLCYQPPAGAIGHALAKLFGSDPKQAMDRDLIRLKSLIEFGKTRVNGGVVTRDNLHLFPKNLVAAGSNTAVM